MPGLWLRNIRVVSPSFLPSTWGWKPTSGPYQIPFWPSCSRPAAVRASPDGNLVPSSAFCWPQVLYLLLHLTLSLPFLSSYLLHRIFLPSFKVSTGPLLLKQVFFFFETKIILTIINSSEYSFQEIQPWMKYTVLVVQSLTQSDSLWSNGWRHIRLPCPSYLPGVLDWVHWVGDTINHFILCCPPSFC